MNHPEEQAERKPERRDVLRMSNKESNRITRECLQTALIYLMSQMPFDKITISELVRRSGVSRTAFYRNYSSKEEILNELCTSFLDMIKESLDNPHFAECPYDWYYNFFQTIRENASSFRLLLQAQVVNTPVFRTFSISRELDRSTETAGHYQYLAWEGALSTIAVHWFQDGMKESIEFMSAFCADLFHR